MLFKIRLVVFIRQVLSAHMSVTVIRDEHNKIPNICLPSADLICFANGCMTHTSRTHYPLSLMLPICILYSVLYTLPVCVCCDDRMHVSTSMSTSTHPYTHIYTRSSRFHIYNTSRNLYRLTVHDRATVLLSVCVDCGVLC